MNAMAKQKRGKSPGPVGILMEAFIHGGPRLKLYLSILFNLAYSCFMVMLLMLFTGLLSYHLQNLKMVIYQMSITIALRFLITNILEVCYITLLSLMVMLMIIS